MDEGVGQLQKSYASLHGGIRALDKNLSKLKSGASELDSGTGELHSETGDLDARVDEEVDGALEKFKGEDFDMVSFVDARNQVELVQFVIKGQAVEMPETMPQAAEAEPQEEDSFGAKLGKLFEGWRDWL